MSLLVGLHSEQWNSFFFLRSNLITTAKLAWQNPWRSKDFYILADGLLLSWKAFSVHLLVVEDQASHWMKMTDQENPGSSLG